MLAKKHEVFKLANQLTLTVRASLITNVKLTKLQEYKYAVHLACSELYLDYITLACSSLLLNN